MTNRLLTLAIALTPLGACVDADPPTLDEASSELGCGWDDPFADPYDLFGDDPFCLDDGFDGDGGGGGGGGLEGGACFPSRQFTGTGEYPVGVTATRSAAEAQSMAIEEAKRRAITDAEQQCRASWTFIPGCTGTPAISSVYSTGCVTHETVDPERPIYQCYAQATASCNYSLW